MPTENTPNAYDLMLEKLDEIEHALGRIETASMVQFAEDIKNCLESIKNVNDQSLLAEMSTSRSYMETILRKNEAIKQRIKGIAAIQRNELNLVRQGRQTAKGYAVHIPSRTGGIINSSN